MNVVLMNNLNPTAEVIRTKSWEKFFGLVLSQCDKETYSKVMNEIFFSSVSRVLNEVTVAHIVTAYEYQKLL